MIYIIFTNPPYFTENLFSLNFAPLTLSLQCLDKVVNRDELEMLKISLLALLNTDFRLLFVVVFFKLHDPISPEPKFFEKDNL